MPGISTRIREWISGQIGDATAKQIATGVVAALAAAGAVAWTWFWHHVNPQWGYVAPTSSVSSHFVGLGQIFNQIDKDSQYYCAGGWDQWLAEFALRRCYKFRFEPPAAYRMTVCTHDEKTVEVSTSDQLHALQNLERAFGPHVCFTIDPQPGKGEYVVRLGKDAKLVNFQYANDAPQATAVCGCTNDEVAEIAQVTGAKLK